MKVERRIASRKDVVEIEVADITSLNHYKIIARAGVIIDASTSGLLLRVNRKDLAPKELRENLSLQAIVGQNVAMFLPQMNLDLDGTITRADHIGRGVFKIGLKFSADVPLYWRECLVDLMPNHEDLEESGRR